jgi:hypothetical protein
MKHLSAATLLIAALAGSTGVLAQNVYRCGSSYSQIPCPDGVPIEAKDARSKAQATQNTQDIKRDASAANALERSRLKDEMLARQTPVANKSRKPTHSKPAPAQTQSKTKKKKEPEYFSATVLQKEAKVATKSKESKETKIPDSTTK